MKTIFFSFFLTILPALAETNYVYYNIQDGRPQQVASTCSYDVTKDAVQLGEFGLSGIDWNLIHVDSFTDPIPVPFTNVSQVIRSECLPSGDWKYSVKRTPQWNDFIITLDAWHPAIDALTTAIGNESAGPAKEADKAIKATLLVLEDQIKAMRKVIGKNMQVEP